MSPILNSTKVYKHLRKTDKTQKDKIKSYADKTRKAKPFTVYHPGYKVLIKNVRPHNKSCSFWSPNIYTVIKSYPASIKVTDGKRTYTRHMLSNIINNPNMLREACQVMCYHKVQTHLLHYHMYLMYETTTDSDATVPHNEPDTVINNENDRQKRERRIPAKFNDFNCSI